MGRNFIFEHLLTKNILQKKIFQIFIPIPWKWPTECFKPDFGHNSSVEISFLNIFWQKKFLKKKTIFIPIPWKWPTECFKPDFGHNSSVEISFLNIFWQTNKKKTIFIPIPWKWTTECFKTDCGHNFLIEIYFFKSIKNIKVTFLILHHFPVAVLPL